MEIIKYTMINGTRVLCSLASILELEGKLDWYYRVWNFTPEDIIAFNILLNDKLTTNWVKYKE